MTIEQLRRLYQSRPFQAFIVHLADGREIPVPSPESMIISPSGRTAAIHFGDAFEIIDLLLVTSLEVKEKQEAKRRRG